VIITNQSGIGRGLYSEGDFHELSSWMKKEIEVYGGVVDAIYFCPSHPIHGIGSYKVESIDRKPNPGMLIKACMDYDIDMQESIFIGDKLSDMQAGISAKVGRNILFSMDKKIKNSNFLKVTSFSEIYKYFSKC
jgi:D-glycero-D-manno-heptose 1,7-bisphosphate phosphatase